MKIDIYFGLFLTTKVWIYGDLIIKFDDYMYIVGAKNGLIFSLVKIKWEYRNQNLGGDANPPYFAAKPPKG